MTDGGALDKTVVKVKLATDHEWAKRGLIAVWKRQTRDEQLERQTRLHNAVGFTGVDAEILSSFAEQVRKGRMLSEKQLVILHRKMPKYAGQLVKIANGEF